MDARLPLHAPGVSLVAVKTGLVYRVRRDALRAQLDHATHPLAAASLDVGGAVAVAGGARAGVGRAPRIGLRAVFRGRVAFKGNGVTILADLRTRARRLRWRRGKSGADHERARKNDGRQHRNQPAKSFPFHTHISQAHH